MKMIPLAETSPSPWPVTRIGLKAILWAAAFGGMVRAAFYLSDHHELPAARRLTLVVARFVPAVVCLHHMGCWVRGLDELQQRLQLQSFAAAFPGLLLAIMGNELLRVAGFPTGIDLSFRSVGIVMLGVYSATFAWLSIRNR